MENAGVQKPLADQGIPLYRPDLSGNEKKYVLDCIDSTWISSIGEYVGKFEKALGQITGAPHAIVVCNGTVALHLAVHCLGIGPGDEVIVPTFTYIASVNAIAQTGATPIFAESRQSDWLIDPTKIEALITPRTKAIMPVHLYGAVCDMPAIMEIARKHGLKVIEDCAESLGATLHGQHTGTFGDIGTFSFFGNKTITTGEGGAVIATDTALSQRLRIVKGQGQSLTRRYWHEELGFNYRMTNIAAAIGFAQSERLPQILARKRTVAKRLPRPAVGSAGYVPRAGCRRSEQRMAGLGAAAARLQPGPTDGGDGRAASGDAPRLFLRSSYADLCRSGCISPHPGRGRYSRPRHLIAVISDIN